MASRVKSRASSRKVGRAAAIEQLAKAQVFGAVLAPREGEQCVPLLANRQSD